LDIAHSVVHIILFKTPNINHQLFNLTKKHCCVFDVLVFLTCRSAPIFSCIDATSTSFNKHRCAQPIVPPASSPTP
jgi:hypothetical protein